MSFKNTINALIAGSLLLTPAFFFAQEPSNQVTTYDRVRDVGFAGAAASIVALIAQGAIHPTFPDQDISAQLTISFGMLSAVSALCAAKAASDTTWRDILIQKKVALLKYFMTATVAGMFVRGLIYSLSDAPHSRIALHLLMGSLGLIPAASAGEYLQEVLSAPEAEVAAEHA